MKLLNLLLLGGAALALFSCSTYSEDELSSFDSRIQKYLEKEKITCEKSESGLYFKIIEEGEGDYIQFRDNVSFTYRGEFLNGLVFDEQKEPIEFNVSSLIAAWKEIMLQVKKGGKVFLIAPPQLGYGTHKLDDIPENSILVYTMEIVDIQ